MFAAAVIAVVIAIVLLASGPSSHITLTPPRRCDDLVAFVDGELSRRRTRRYRAHLRTCAECRTELAEQLDLSARLSDLPPKGPPP